jgi:ATP-dependent DNA ligase
MNIFQFLGLPKDHRKDDKVTQLVKHWDEVIDKHKEGKKFGIQLKRDGVCSLTVVDNFEVAIFSRTGKQFTNTSDLIERVEKLQLPNGVYMGEIWLPKKMCSLEKLSGMVSPNRVNFLDQDAVILTSQLRLSFFDLISIESFRKGTASTKYARRQTDLYGVAGMKTTCNPYIDVLDFVMTTCEGGIDFGFEAAIEGGEEGIVIRDPDANWEAGHKGWRVMKKVRGVSYDLRCISYEEGSGKYKGKVANLIFKWKSGKTIKAMLGKGWTHDMAEQMFRDIIAGSVGDESYPLGRIFKVYALEESSKGKLRLPKVKERRFDKVKPDV